MACFGIYSLIDRKTCECYILQAIYYQIMRVIADSISSLFLVRQYCINLKIVVFRTSLQKQSNINRRCSQNFWLSVNVIAFVFIGVFQLSLVR